MDHLNIDPSTGDVDLLVEISKLFTYPELNDVLQRVIDLAATTVGATNATMVVYDGMSVEWRYVTSFAQKNHTNPDELITTVMEHGLAGWVAKNREMALIEDTENDPRWRTLSDPEHHARSALCLPLIFKDELTAIMTLAHKEPNHFTPNHVRLMTIIANQAAVAVHNARLVNRVQAQQRQLENMIRAIPDILLALDYEGNILVANDAALGLLGATKREGVIGKHLSTMIQRNDSLGIVLEIVEEMSSAGLPIEPHLTFETHSEQLKQDFQITMSNWEDAITGENGYMALMHDVTTLRDLHRFKDEMLHIASHDLRGPLGLIVGYTNMISLDTPDPNSPVHEYLEEINRSTTRMDDLLEALLRVEQVKSSPLELHEWIEPQKLIKVAVVNMRQEAANKHIIYDSQLKLNDNRTILADPVLIRQAMENLIGNAIKYTHEGGKVTVYADIDDGRFNFRVEDSGIGISEEYLPYVFESFYRVPDTDFEAVTGKGLGLSLVKNVIERHSGKVWVESRRGKGSTFGFWIPARKEVSQSP
jgi:PAS domain S-box-containing protein